MCCFYHTSNTINLVSATKYTAFGVIEYCIFMKDLVDCSATTHGVIFAKYVAQITKQQGRYAVGHRVLRFRSWTASHPTLANFMTFVVATLAFFNLNSRVRFCGFWLIDDSRFRSRTSKSLTHNPTPRPHAGVSPKTVQENHVRSPPRLVVVDLLPQDFD